MFFELFDIYSMNIYLLKYLESKDFRAMHVKIPVIWRDIFVHYKTYRLFLIIYCSQKYTSKYSKTLNISGIKFSRFNENDKLTYYNVGGHDIPWIQIVKKI